ncbi:TLD-domain-containing protein [Chytriomyces sp. MP71]|nr:TLD-domain-containing protein [Chytriomyces sp. MP71]
MVKVYDSPDLEKTKLLTMVRAGIPNELRAKVYRKLLKVDKMDEYEKNFEIALKRTYGANIPKSPMPPMFGGRTHQNDLVLSSYGLLVAEHILCILAHDFPSLEYCPFVPTLTVLLCHHINDVDDALGAMVSIVKQAFAFSQPSLDCLSPAESKRQKSKEWKFFPTYRKDVKFMSRAFSNLLNANNAKLHQHISDLHAASAEPIWTRWITDFYVDIAPQPVLWRLLDSFLVEGYKTLFRFGIALLLSRKDAIFKCKTYHAFSALFDPSTPAITPADLTRDALLLSSWSLKLTPAADIRSGNHLHSTLLGISTADDLHEQHLRYQRATPKLAHTTHTRADGTRDDDALKGSTILREEHWIVLWSWIPPSLRVAELELLFATRTHGHAVSTLYARTRGRRPLVMVVETSVSVFGAFLSEAWPEDEAGRGVFYGTGETFLFTLSPFAKLYPWVGRVDEESLKDSGLQGVGSAGMQEEGDKLSHKDYLRFQASMFIMANRHDLTVGGGGGSVGLWLNEDLSYGRTGTCLTFENSPLTGTQEQQFDCLNVEVFAFT